MEKISKNWQNELIGNRPQNVVNQNCEIKRPSQYRIWDVLAVFSLVF